jgi:hypothetical protein
MTDEMKKYGCSILVALILCMGLPIIWLEFYRMHHCLFPPSGPNVEVIVSACEWPIMTDLSPDGRYISYWTATTNGSQSWLLDTVTGERRKNTSCGISWLTNAVRLGAWTPSDGYSWEFKVCDINDGSEVSAQWVEGMAGTVTQQGDGTRIYDPKVVQWFQNAEQVYFIAWHRWAVALGPDFKSHPENNYVMAIPRRGSYWIEDDILKLLNDNQIAYTVISYPNSGYAGVSHNGQFATPLFRDGFYTVDGTRIGPLYGNLTNGYKECCTAYGWAYDDSGIYVQGDTVGSGGMFPYPAKAQPILKLNLPDEYLSPAALQTQEVRQNQARRALLIRISTMVLLPAGIWFFWWRKRKYALKH